VTVIDLPMTSQLKGGDEVSEPYRAYDIAGNTTSSTTGTQATTYTYPAPTAPQPHAPLTAGTSSYRYDADGQMTRRTISGQREYLDWTPRGQLASITGPGGDSSFTYDTTGSRLTRTTPQGTTLYLPGSGLTADTHGAVTGTRYYTIGGATIALRASGSRPRRHAHLDPGRHPRIRPAHHPQRQHHPGGPAVPALRVDPGPPHHHRHRPRLPIPTRSSTLLTRTPSTPTPTPTTTPSPTPTPPG
jgi:YD repeat-containing protein